MKAIQTKYLSPTNTRGSRIKAFDWSGNSIIIEFDYALDALEANFKAAMAFIDKMGWNWTRDKISYGVIKSGHVFCFNGRD